MAGKLYLCATPIGNLEDMTFRAVRKLREVDLIAAEDTRNSIKLLNHFDIHTPMTSYHEHNKIEKGKELVQRMREGENVALITDAGTPGISDPGYELVVLCKKEEIEVTALPGCVAGIAALTISGLPTRRFVFEGFLPTEKKERQAVLERLKLETRTIIFYEAPHRLKKTLALLLEELGDRKISICRELTKMHEEVYTARLSEAVLYYNQREPKGEYVLVLSGADEKKLKLESQKEWLLMDINEHMAIYEAQGIEKKEAMKLVARDRGVTKREVYKELLDRKE